MADTATGNPKIALSKPVDFNGETFSELTFREPDVGCMIDAESAGDGERAQVVGMLAAMCGVPIEAFRKISVRDFTRITNATRHFMENFGEDGGENGETSPS